MVKCWKHSEGRCSGGGLDSSHFPHKAFWISLSALLLLVTVALGLAGHLALTGPRSKSLQSVRITSPDQLNQSAVVDLQNRLVTFSVTSSGNRTSTVLFDVKHGLICYKPLDQNTCFLQIMERSDYDHVGAFLNQSQHKRNVQLSGNETQRRTEFLGVLSASQVNESALEEPLGTLCRDRSVHWTRRTDGFIARPSKPSLHDQRKGYLEPDSGPGKQRLVYFCIDICFPSNICVSVCFYYLPE